MQYGSSIIAENLSFVNLSSFQRGSIRYDLLEMGP